LAQVLLVDLAGLRQDGSVEREEFLIESWKQALVGDGVERGKEQVFVLLREELAELFELRVLFEFYLKNAKQQKLNDVFDPLDRRPSRTELIMELL